MVVIFAARFSRFFAVADAVGDFAAEVLPQHWACTLVIVEKMLHRGRVDVITSRIATIFYRIALQTPPFQRPSQHVRRR